MTTEARADATGGRPPGRLRILLTRHRALLAILAVYAIVWIAVPGRGSHWATLSVECVAGTVGEAMLGEPAWGPWSVIDGLVGGQVFYAAVALPFWLLLGTAGGLGGKLAAFSVSVGLLLLIYALGCRASGRPAGALAAAGVAFAPPVIFASSMMTGNWHWSELVFDYGTGLTALLVAWPRGRPADRPTPHLGLAMLAMLSGLGAFNSPQSLPFIALAWVVAALGCGPRRLLKGAPACLLGAGVGLALPIWRLAGMSAKQGGPPGAPLWRRLVQFNLDWSKLTDLVWPELPVTLHIREATPFLSPETSGGLETAWVLVCWTGCLLTVVGVIERWRRKRDDGGALVASLLPVGFCLAFAAAYLALEVRIRIADPLFSEYRQASHRILPPLIVAMVVGAAPGWIWLWRRLGSLGGGPARYGLRALVLSAALLAPSIGLFSQGSMAASAPGGGGDGLSLYRGSCFDPPGFFMYGHREDRGYAEERCESLSTQHRRDECLTGVAIGVGFYSARLSGPGEWPEFRDDEPCSHAPPDFARRCNPWDPTQTPELGQALERACRSVPEERRAVCFQGAGWYTSQVVWGTDMWPITGCESVAEEADREACWRGPGFQLGDHMSHTPHRLAPLMQRVPPHRRPAVARGVGWSVGTAWAARHVALDVCSALGPDLAVACEEGVEIARLHAHPEPAQR